MDRHESVEGRVSMDCTAPRLIQARQQVHMQDKEERVGRESGQGREVQVGDFFFLIHRSHSISFTRAHGIPKYKIGFARVKGWESWGKIGFEVHTPL